MVFCWKFRMLFWISYHLMQSLVLWPLISDGDSQCLVFQKALRNLVTLCFEEQWVCPASMDQFCQSVIWVLVVWRSLRCCRSLLFYLACGVFGWKEMWHFFSKNISLSFYRIELSFLSPCGCQPMFFSRHSLVDLGRDWKAMLSKLLDLLFSLFCLGGSFVLPFLVIIFSF